MKKQLCSKCRRELDWEEEMLIASMTHNDLVKFALAMKQELSKLNKEVNK